MNIQEARQRIAQLVGGTVDADGYLVIRDDTYRELDRDFDLDTLDGLAALWPEEWRWERFGGEWEALHEVPSDRRITVPDTGDEIHDRTILTAMVLAKGTT